MNRQKQILSILVLLMIAAVVSAYLRWPCQKSTDTLKYTPGQQSSAAVTVQPLATPSGDNGKLLRLDLLDREHAQFKGYTRNLFKSFQVEDVKAAKQKKEPAKSILPALSPSLVIADAPRRELVQFTFVGYLEADKRKTVFLSRGKEMLLVREGKVFAGKYRAVAITDQALTIQVMGTDDQIVIPLVENRSLRIAAK